MRSTALRQVIISSTVVVLGLLPSVCGSAARAVSISLPPVNGQFDYQIGGAYTPMSSVAIVDRDRHDPIVPGKYNICYVNAFQTQPGAETTWWKANHADLVLKKANGSYVEDPDWPGEFILDTSTAAKRASIAKIEDGWIDGCSTAGFKAIEPDNLDSYTRSDNLLTLSENIALARLLASHAHSQRLAFAQKNDTDVTASDKATVGFDFAIAEECGYYQECAAYTDLYRKHVIEIEYTDNGRSAYTKACKARGASLSIIYRDRDVVPRGDSAYHYEFC
jgi:Glycoside-hydrolase family GH114